jgi:alpha-ribazole phosphatase
MIVTRWWWVRHAPVPGPADLIKGRLDLPSDTSDAATFATQAARLPKNAVAVTSSRLRARQTAAALAAAGWEAPPPRVEADFDEQDFGRWAGRTWTELGQEPGLDAFWADPARTAPPGGESFADQVDRVRGGVARIGATYAGRDIVAVAHAGTIRAALCIALGVDPTAALNFTIGTVSISRIDAVDEAWRVQCVNWTAEG